MFAKNEAEPAELSTLEKLYNDPGTPITAYINIFEDKIYKNFIDNKSDAQKKYFVWSLGPTGVGKSGVETFFKNRADEGKTGDAASATSTTVEVDSLVQSHPDYKQAVLSILLGFSLSKRKSLYDVDKFRLTKPLELITETFADDSPESAVTKEELFVLAKKLQEAYKLVRFGDAYGLNRDNDVALWMSLVGDEDVVVLESVGDRICTGSKDHGTFLHWLKVDSYEKSVAVVYGNFEQVRQNNIDRASKGIQYFVESLKSIQNTDRNSKSIIQALGSSSNNIKAPRLPVPPVNPDKTEFENIFKSIHCGVRNFLVNCGSWENYFPFDIGCLGNSQLFDHLFIFDNRDYKMNPVIQIHFKWEDGDYTTLRLGKGVKLEYGEKVFHPVKKEEALELVDKVFKEVTGLDFTVQMCSVACEGPGS